MSVRAASVGTPTLCADDEVWRQKRASDAGNIVRCLSDELRPLHDIVHARARQAGASALILSGSTARLSRTAISDLDYHLVGPEIATSDLSGELDLHTLTAAKLEEDLLSGDDFVQWSLRFGSVVFDDGVVRRLLGMIFERQLWPDVERKRHHAAKSLALARRFVATGDEDGALVQVRTALSLAARARLLHARVFPLSRAELPSQLQAIGCPEAAGALAASIHAEPGLAELAGAVRQGEELLDPVAAVADAEAAD